MAAELAIHYGALGLVTDYDCWHEDPDESVNVQLVDVRLVQLREKAHFVIKEAIKEIEKTDWQLPHTRAVRIANSAIMKR